MKELLDSLLPFATLLAPILLAYLAVMQSRAATKAEVVRTTLQTQGQSTDAQLGKIHELVNSRLTKALDTIADLKAMLVEKWPDDPRVQALIDRADNQGVDGPKRMT